MSLSWEIKRESKGTGTPVKNETFFQEISGKYKALYFQGILFSGHSYPTNATHPGHKALLWIICG